MVLAVEWNLNDEETKQYNILTYLSLDSEMHQFCVCEKKVKRLKRVLTDFKFRDFFKHNNFLTKNASININLVTFITFAETINSYNFFSILSTIRLRTFIAKLKYSKFEIQFTAAERFARRQNS